MRLAYFDCFSGISGDMFIASLLDAGMSLRALSAELKRLGVSGYELKKSPAKRGALRGTRFECVERKNQHAHRSLKSILDLIDKSSLNKRVKETAKGIFISIGRVEARIHGFKSLSDVHFHELGGIDSIIDIVGAAAAVEILGIDKVFSSAINMGRGMVDTKSGVLPVPSPASMELLKGAPVRISNIDSELVTPTGAGILKYLSKGFGEMPQMKIASIGYGAGSKDIPGLPNMLRVVIGETRERFRTDRVMTIETNIDDMSPQGFEYLFERLFKEGALDVYISTVQMKKTRPGFKLTVIADHSDLDRLASVIFSETTSIGLRFHESDRYKLDRQVVKARTKYGDIAVKVARGPDGVLTRSPEYDECVKAARKRKVPLRIVYDEAKTAVRI